MPLSWTQTGLRIGLGSNKCESSRMLPSGMSHSQAALQGTLAHSGSARTSKKQLPGAGYWILLPLLQKLFHPYLQPGWVCSGLTTDPLWM